MNRETADKAEHYFRQGFNCAEAVLLAAVESYDLQLQPDAVRLATGFGGGLGRGDVCGALSGAVLALGAAKGRISTEQDQDRFKSLRELIVAEFEAGLGTICCRDLKTEDREDCVPLVRKGAAALAAVVGKSVN